MKTLYLYDSDKGWMLFEYDVLSDLAHEFSIRNIRIGNGCWLGNDCKLGYDCELGDSCKQYTISKWLSNYEKIGRSNNYSDKEIEEYWMYIDLIRRIHESGALM